MVNKSSIVILTDSAAGIARSKIQDQPISLINFTVTINNQSFADTIENNDRYHLIEQVRQAAESVSTAQSSRFVVEQHVKKLLSYYQQVVYLCVSPRLSGQYHSLKVLEKKTAFRNKFFIIPCYNSGIGQKYLVFKAARMACNGQSCLDIIRFVKKADHRLIWTSILIADLVLLRRSGRMKFIFASLLERINCRLMVTIHNRRFFVKRKIATLCELVLKAYQRFQTHYQEHVKLVILISKQAVQGHYFRLVTKFFAQHQIRYDVDYDVPTSALVHSGVATVTMTILAGSVLNDD